MRCAKAARKENGYELSSAVREGLIVEFELSDNQKNIIATFRAFGEEVFTADHVFQWRRDQGLPDEGLR